ncbi:MAG: acetyl-CoA carboxylase biotin carboxylase subunit [Acidobacteriota bacterium]
MFKKILVANRGEIAIRVMKACRLMGIHTIAIYSDADEHSLHLQYADEAVRIGFPDPLSSYLNIEAIIKAAKERGAEAIHPGYGFLAENSHFSRRCFDESLIFIGPPCDAVALMGDKVTARKMMSKQGIPIIPGMTSAGNDPKSLERFASQIGYPVIIKASAGGGGKGMRIISRESDLLGSAQAAAREAEKAFGDGRIYLEKFLERPRHIEFQILVDHHGNAIHLFERECSIQRRYQKIVEETPSPALTPELRKEMGATAIKIALTAGYRNAGTVEFLLDQNQRFYFLEMNTRVQVEHPITEMTTGVDIVCEQLRIASGEKLTLSQEKLFQRGHSIECRIYAEDPENNFLPSPGKILVLREPVGPGIRVDSGIYQGFEVPVHYDPILSKLIVFAENRAMALKKMRVTLSEYKILGIKNNIAFLTEIIGHPEFEAGNTHTKFIEEHLGSWKRESKKYCDIALIAAALMESERNGRIPFGQMAEGTRMRPSPWQTVGYWRVGESGR